MPFTLFPPLLVLNRGTIEQFLAAPQQIYLIEMGRTLTLLEIWMGIPCRFRFFTPENDLALVLEMEHLLYMIFTWLTWYVLRVTARKLWRHRASKLCW
jgi:hypothetical protein